MNDEQRRLARLTNLAKVGESKHLARAVLQREGLVQYDPTLGARSHVAASHLELELLDPVYVGSSIYFSVRELTHQLVETGFHFVAFHNCLLDSVRPRHHHPA